MKMIRNVDEGAANHGQTRYTRRSATCEEGVVRVQRREGHLSMCCGADAERRELLRGNHWKPKKNQRCKSRRVERAS